MDPGGKMWERDDQLFNQMNALAGAITDSPEVVFFRFHCYLTSLLMPLLILIFCPRASLSCLMLLLIQVLSQPRATPAGAVKKGAKRRVAGMVLPRERDEAPKYGLAEAELKSMLVLATADARNQGACSGPLHLSPFHASDHATNHNS